MLVVAALLLTAAPARAVVNGEADDDEQNPLFPNVGAIVGTKVATTFPNVDAPQAFSSGTLIHPRVLLTAGHSVAFMFDLMENGGLELEDFVVSFDPDVTTEGHDPDSASTLCWCIPASVSRGSRTSLTTWA